MTPSFLARKPRSKVVPHLQMENTGDEKLEIKRN